MAAGVFEWPSELLLTAFLWFNSLLEEGVIISISRQEWEQENAYVNLEHMD